MTVASAVARSGPYAGNGSQTVFAYTFKVFAASELQVVLRSASGVETVQTLTTHYTVSGVGNDAGGNVTMVTAPPTGATLTIVRNVPFVQLTDLRNQGGFYPEVHERVFDRIVMQTQQLAEEVGRSVKLSVTSTIDPDVFNQSINTLAENVDDVNAVAANMADVQAVAAIDADVQLAAANVADITNFADVYQGAKATDPTLRNDSTALQAGDLYFNTASAKMRVYSGSVWVDAGTPIPLTITTQQFSGTGSQTVFTLSSAPAFPAALDVFISGVSQKLTADYTVSGTTLTFVAAPPAGTNNIYVKILSAYAGGVPNDDSVTTAKLANSAVTLAKLDFAVTGMVAYFPGNAAPLGWLKINGVLLSRTTYAALWAYAQASGNIVTDAAWLAGATGSFSQGDGSTTFRLPDYRGEFLRGWDDGRGLDSGRAIGGSAQAGQNLAHTHTPVHSDGNGFALNLGGGSRRLSFTTDGVAVEITTTSDGGSEARPRNIALLACIKF